MYKDNSLMPAEAVRLAALGLLWRQERPYAELAAEIRHFTGRIVGPSLELLGPSLELLKVEGLIASADETQPREDQVMALTEAGRAELHRLMNASLRGPLGEINKLIIALKLHFFAVLTPVERRQQCDLLVRACDKELLRLDDLKARLGDVADSEILLSWLDQEIGEIEGRRSWFLRLGADLGV
jgi:DNA-binding PadR family transcriptional regulator